MMELNIFLKPDFGCPLSPHNFHVDPLGEFVEAVDFGYEYSNIELLRHADTHLVVQFNYSDYRVTVFDDGEIRVEPNNEDEKS